MGKVNLFSTWPTTPPKFLKSRTFKKTNSEQNALHWAAKAADDCLRLRRLQILYDMSDAQRQVEHDLRKRLGECLNENGHGFDFEDFDVTSKEALVAWGRKLNLIYRPFWGSTDTSIKFKKCGDLRKK